MNIRVIGVLIAILAIIIFAIANPIIIVGAGKRGVVLEWGAVQPTILDEGMHWVTPVSQSVQEMDVTILKEEKVTSASSKDLQIVTSKVAVNYHYDPLFVNKIYQNLKHDASSIVVAPAVEESGKRVTAQYTAEELITKREMVKNDLKEAISDLLAKHHIIVDEVYMTDFNFSEEFNNAIEAKVTAEQNALQAKNVLEQRKYEADQVIVAAQAEAEKIKIQAQAINSQGGRDYVQMRAIEKWNGILPTSMIPNASVPFLRLNEN